MKHAVVMLLLVAAAGCKSPDTPAPAVAPRTSASTPAQAQSLYKRLGGYDAIAAVTDEFLARMIADKQLGRYFTGLSQGSREVIREHIVEFLCYEAKGPCVYVGRDLGEAHTGLNISESDWQTAVKHLNATLDKFKVPAREHQELVSAIATFKEDIVGK